MKPHRRDFLLGATGLALTGVGSERTSHAAPYVIESAKYRAESQRYVDELDKLYDPEDEVTFTPEHERFLDEILLTPGNYPAEGFLQIYGGLLQALPEYTHIRMLLANDQIEDIHHHVQALGFSSRVEYVEVPDQHTEHVDIWAQDLGEVVTVNGERKILLPMHVDKRAYRQFERDLKLFADGSQRINDRSEMLDSAMGESVIRSRFAFEGGNVIPEMIHGKPTVFVGYDVILLTHFQYLELGARLSQKNIEQIISEDFGGARVVTLGDSRQLGTQRFHIDRVVTLLQGNTAILAPRAAIEIDRRYILQDQLGARADHNEQMRLMRRQLMQRGYHVGRLRGDIENMTDDGPSYINGVPFIDKSRGSGEPCFLMPVSRAQLHSEIDTSAPITLNSLGESARQAASTFERAGYRVIPVLDIAFKHTGGTHCLMNILAQNNSGQTSLASL